MCKKMTVAYGDYIGQRLVGWCVFNGKDYSFLSDKQIKARLGAGDLVNGLALDAEGNVVLDKEFASALMAKSGLTFNPIAAADDDGDEPVMNKYYALVKVSKGKDGKQYHFITNRCGYEVFSEEQLKAMLSVMELGGVRLDGKGKLEIHKGVETEDATESQRDAKGNDKDGGKVG